MWVPLVPVPDLPRRRGNGPLVVAGTTFAEPVAAVPPELPAAVAPVLVPAGGSVAAGVDPDAVGAVGVPAVVVPDGEEAEVPVAGDVDPAGAGVVDAPDAPDAPEAPVVGVVDEAPEDELEVVEDDPPPMA